MNKQEALHIVTQVCNHYGNLTLPEALKVKEALEVIATLEEPKVIEVKPDGESHEHVRG